MLDEDFLAGVGDRDLCVLHDGGLPYGSDKEDTKQTEKQYRNN